ncbi:MAG: hypothetical protein JWO52_2392 [Gammaproteobacteria bacterium]|nr:hypothetical protein [Gammaproteobacteria bacterium]
MNCAGQFRLSAVPSAGLRLPSWWPLALHYGQIRSLQTLNSRKHVPRFATAGDDNCDDGAMPGR